MLSTAAQVRYGQPQAGKSGLHSRLFMPSGEANDNFSDVKSLSLAIFA